MAFFGKKRKLMRVGIATLLAVAFFSFDVSCVFAAEPLMSKGYRAMQVIGAQSITIEPGATKQYMIGFQNTGDKTWYRDEGAFVSVYTYSPKYRDSEFESDSWFRDIQPTKLQEVTVAPNEVGHILFDLKAPNVRGNYEETFYLAAENKVWIPGGEFTINITVADPQPPATSTNSSLKSG
ncbi:MAG: hypothetical protein ABIH21_05550, partial [Patescibacteria group bacterium]